VGSIRRHIVLVDVEAAELLVVPFAADGGGMGRQLPKRSMNHGCYGGLEPSHVWPAAGAALEDTGVRARRGMAIDFLGRAKYTSRIFLLG
jgi:hypothetical protein